MMQAKQFKVSIFGQTLESKQILTFSALHRDRPDQQSDQLSARTWRTVT